jgi:hypothetical protein
MEAPVAYGHELRMSNAQCPISKVIPSGTVSWPGARGGGDFGVGSWAFGLGRSTRCRGRQSCRSLSCRHPETMKTQLGLLSGFCVVRCRGRAVARGGGPQPCLSLRSLRLCGEDIFGAVEDGDPCGLT